jgi:hypothetical protein
MAGSFDLDNSTPSLSGNALAINVYLYVLDYGGEASYTILPNVRCLAIETREGPNPPVARFRYIMDDNLALNLGWPSQFEEVWPIDAQGNYVVYPDDRLVVMGQNPDGSPMVLFDGFAQIPQVDVTSGSQRVTFAAVGAAVRCFDDVVHTRVQRDADMPNDTSGGSDFEIHASCRFNPSDNSVGAQGGILGNSTPNAFYTSIINPTTNQTENYPVFIDPLLIERGFEEQNNDQYYVEPWFISDAILYILSQPNPGDAYVVWPSNATITTILSTLVPPPGSNTFNPETAVPADCVIRDYDATGKSLPQVLADLLGYAGFLFCWQVDADSDGNPETYLKIYRRDAAAVSLPKLVFLAPSDSGIVDLSTSNLTNFHLARDANAIVNAWRTETNQRQVEISVTLAPLFEPAASDALAVANSTTTGRGQFFKSSFTTETPAVTQRKYRWYGADECGDGHWNAQTGKWSVQPIDLSPVFPNTNKNTKSYVSRYRPGSHTLNATDSAGRPLSVMLEICFGMNSSDPYVSTSATSAANWQLVTGGWRLLPDRLGIEVTVEDPENWNGGKGVGDVRGVTWQAEPPVGKNFALRLTTVIDDDRRISAEAPMRTASPTQFARWRSADAKDHFQYASISVGSRNYQQAGGDGTNPVVVRDDTVEATTHAQQLRSAYEFPPLVGNLTIPYITTYYEVGDRIQEIAGRDASLQSNVGASTGESPSYPWVIGVSWIFEPDRQQTVLHLSDWYPGVRNLP